MLADWFGIDDVFWLTVFFIFLVTIVGALVRRLRKDKCLKLLHDDHVTYLTDKGRPLWGDLAVSGHGLELRYDAPYTTSRGLVKTSYLAFPDEACAALCRTVHGLTEDEKKAREKQIRASFDPGLVRRFLRGCRNFVNIVRDAISKALGVFVGAVATRGTGVAKAVGSRKGEVDELGSTLLGVVANAYEPLLERHIGRPVVLQVQTPAGTTGEYPGYLVDYTEKYVAVFNVDHAPEQAIELGLDASATGEGLEVELEEDRAHLRCTGPDLVVLHSVESGGGHLDLGITLLPGCSLDLPRAPGQPVRIRAERTRRADLVCPRSRARVRYGSAAPEARPGWEGLAPEDEGPATP